ncbi:MAG: hypothetical protein VYA86_05905 [Candidatus Thermoplasmatota archaeon]|nr:hypothetical protein [Candidatus Thermoplasmatota archaeon]
MVDLDCINRAAAAHRAAVAHLLASHKRLVHPLLSVNSSAGVSSAVSSLNDAYISLAQVGASRITDLERLMALFGTQDSLFERARTLLTHRLARHIEWANKLESGATIASPDALLPPPSHLDLDIGQLQELLGIVNAESPDCGITLPENSNPSTAEIRAQVPDLPLPLQDSATRLLSTIEFEEDAHSRRQSLLALFDNLSIDPLGVCPLPGLHSDAILPLIMMW